MSEEIKNTEQQPTTPTPEASGGQGGERMFTQEEVNRIVSERLAREREKLTQQPKEDEREQALKAREARLDCREYLDTQGYPAALLDVLDSSDTAKFKAAVDKLVKAFPRITGAPTFSGWKPGETAHKNGAGTDRIAVAFKPKA